MKFLNSTDRACATLFALFGCLTTLLVVLGLPPFMGPDELNHTKRANMIVLGQLIGQPAQVDGVSLSGGPAEPTLDQAEGYFHPIEFHPEVKVSDDSVQRASKIGWGAKREWEPFENTAIYAPFFYIPSCIAIGIAKAAGSSILQTLGFARIVNAICCLVACFFAIRFAGRAKFLLYTVLLLPMSTMLFSVVSQDGLLIGASAHACILLLRGEGERALNKKEVWAAAICLSLVGLAKPPYILFGLIFLVANVERPQWRWIAALGTVAVGTAWNLAMTIYLHSTVRRPGAILDPGGQIHYLLGHPAAPISIAIQTLKHSTYELTTQTLGVLGWLDTPLPKPYYGVALLILIAGALLTCTPKSKEEWKRSLVVLGLLVCTVVGIFAALYVTYTPVGAARVDGVQGRYFLPVLCLAPFALGLGKSAQPILKGRLRQGAILCVLAFPIASFWVVKHALSHRYW